jgi:hypothetical protein
MTDERSEENDKPMSNALYQDNRTAAISKVERKPAQPSARKLAAGTYQPHGFEDLRYRIKYTFSAGCSRSGAPRS